MSSSRIARFCHRCISFRDCSIRQDKYQITVLYEEAFYNDTAFWKQIQSESRLNLAPQTSLLFSIRLIHVSKLTYPRIAIILLKKLCENITVNNTKEWSAIHNRKTIDPMVYL